MRQSKLVLVLSLVVAALMLLSACAPNLSVSDTPKASGGETGGPEPEGGSGSPDGQQDEKIPFLTEFNTVDINGDEATAELFSDYKLNMVNIWATYCGPCLSEMPDLGEINAEYADKGFQVVGVVMDVFDGNGEISQSQVDIAKEIADKTGATYPHILPSVDMAVNVLSGVSAVPTTVFVDSGGYAVGKAYMGARSKSDWTAIIDELLTQVEDNPGDNGNKQDEAAALSKLSNVEVDAARSEEKLIDENLPFYGMDAPELNGGRVTQDYMFDYHVTMALIWDPAWEGSADALRKMQAYMDAGSESGMLGLLINGDADLDKAKEMTDTAGVKFSQLVPEGAFAEYLRNRYTKDEPQVVLVSSWGGIVDEFEASTKLSKWNGRVMDAIDGVLASCCG